MESKWRAARGSAVAPVCADAALANEAVIKRTSNRTIRTSAPKKRCSRKRAFYLDTRKTQEVKLHKHGLLRLGKSPECLVQGGFAYDFHKWSQCPFTLLKCAV